MKKIMSTLFASVMIVIVTFNAFGLATYAEATSPKFYVDITYETEDKIRADIMFENIPEFANGGFLVHYDTGWTPAINRIGEPAYA